MLPPPNMLDIRYNDCMFCTLYI